VLEAEMAEAKLVTASCTMMLRKSYNDLTALEKKYESRQYQLRRSTIKAIYSAIQARIDAVLNNLLNGTSDDIKTV
jgi:hypothetical protein